MTVESYSTQSINGKTAEAKAAVEAKKLNVYYGNFHAVRDVDLKIEEHKITSMIGPSGCGKSTVLRCFNRMNDLVSIARIEGEIAFQGQNIYESQVDPVEVRRRIGMVFQKPNPFSKSIYENIAWARASTALRATWTNWSNDRCVVPRCGTK